jgi:hypothetical protein
MSLTKDILEAQDASTSTSIIFTLENDSNFLSLSNFEGALIYNRDMEDDTKLAEGIKYVKWDILFWSHEIFRIGINRGTLPVNFQAEPYILIDVLGKTPEDVVNVILTDVGDKAESGALIVLCGLSGTG